MGKRNAVDEHVSGDATSAVEALWGGVYPAALTMFDADGGFDEAATADHLDWLISQGADGVVVGGTSGEFIGLTLDERVRLISAAVGAIAGRVPVFAGTGAYSTAATIQLTQAAAEAGADAAIVILPYYQRPSRAEVVRHFLTVGAASPIPIVAYNNPSNSGAPELRAEDLAELYQSGAIRAVKSTFASVHQVHEALAAIRDERFRVFYGSFTAPLEALAGGAHGWISGILNVATPDALTLCAAIRRGDLPGARSAWARILLIRRLYTEGLVGPVSDLALYRGILSLRGVTAGHCRAPLLDLSEVQMERLAAILGDTAGPDRTVPIHRVGALGGQQ